MAQSASISANIAGRYAQAVFDIAREDGAIDPLAKGVDSLAEALDVSADLRKVIASPLLGREDQTQAITALADKLALPASLANALALMGQNRRLFTLPQLIARLRDLIADERGEVTADVISAQALSSAQAKRLREVLAEKSGKKVKLNTRVDEGLIGGMIVKLGSSMIDSSIRSRLSALQNAMKEVG